MTDPIHEYVEITTLRGALVLRNRTTKHRMFGTLSFPTEEEAEAFLSDANARPGARVLYFNCPVPRGAVRVPEIPDDDSPAEVGQEGEE